MKLAKAPVIQTWIGFAFEPSPRKRKWEFDDARVFLQRYTESFTRIEALFEETVQVQEISPTRQEILAKTVGLDRIRAWDEGGTRWLQLADDLLVYNVTRGGPEYPGYLNLRDEALEKVADYVKHFRPLAVRHAELHYVDMIEIPRPPGGKINLEDYFNLRLETPDMIGTALSFSFNLLWRTEGSENILDVRIQSEPPNAGSKSYRFRTDWHMMCPNIESIETDVLRRRLDAAHEGITNSFRASMTDKTWSLFEPYEED